jgi:hypothetical protein
LNKRANGIENTSRIVEEVFATLTWGVLVTWVSDMSYYAPRCIEKEIFGITLQHLFWINTYDILMFDYVGSYRRYKTRSEFNNWPVARTGHSITQAHNVTFMFGGFINKYGKVKMHCTKIIAATFFCFSPKNVTKCLW